MGESVFVFEKFLQLGAVSNMKNISSGLIHEFVKNDQGVPCVKSTGYGGDPSGMREHRSTCI